MWLRLWSGARVYFGLTTREFYRLTPRQYFAMLDRRKEQIEHTELLTGIVAATVANHSFNPPKQPSTPANYMPSQVTRKVKERVPVKRINRKRIATDVRNFLTSIGHK